MTDPLIFAVFILIKCSLVQIHVYTKHGDFDPDNTFLFLISQEKLLLSILDFELALCFECCMLSSR